MKGKKWTSRVIGSLIMGLGIGMLLTLSIAALGAYLIGTEKLPVNGTDWIVVLAVLAGSTVACAVVRGREQQLGLLANVTGAVAYLVGLFCMAAIFFGGVVRGVGVTALLVFCGCALTCLVRRNGRKKVKFKMPKAYA